MVKSITNGNIVVVFELKIDVTTGSKGKAGGHNLVYFWPLHSSSSLALNPAVKPKKDVSSTSLLSPRPVRL